MKFREVLTEIKIDLKDAIRDFKAADKKNYKGQLSNDKLKTWANHVIKGAKGLTLTAAQKKVVDDIKKRFKI